MKFKPTIAILSTICVISAQACAQDESEGGPGDSDSGSGTFSSITDIFSSGTKTKVTSGKDTPNINEVQSEAYDGPKARIAVARFTDKTRSGWYSGRIGDGMADQLATALFNSNRFIVLERRTLGDVLKEQNLGASGRVRRDTAAPIGQIEGAELLVTGAVTEFERGKSGTKTGGSGLFGNVLGAVTGAFSRSHIAIDMRVIDTRTSRVVAATSVEGEATDVNIGGALGGYYGGGRLGGALSTWDKEPIGKALRISINEAVKFVVSKTPPIYYRHGGGTAGRKSPPTTRRRASTPPAASFAAGTVVRVKSSSLNVRQGPGGKFPVVFRARGGESLRVMQQQGSWIEVEDQNGRVGWAASWLTVRDTGAPPRRASSSRPAPAAAASSSSNDALVSRLKKLKTLYDQGLISESEYKSKRQEILEKL